MTAVLYATHGGFGATDTNLYTVAVPGATVTAVGDTGHFFTGLAFDPTDPTKLYGVTGNLGADQRTLFLIDALTGGVTLVGALGTTIADITFDSTGQMYGWKVSNRKLVTIDKATVAIVEVGVSGLGSSAGNGLAVDPNDDNVVWLFPQGGAGDIFNANKTTGAATDMGVLSPTVAAGSNVAAASFDSSGVLWGLGTGGEVFTVGAPNGFGEYPETLVGTLPNDEPWDGMAWSISTPEPPPTPSTAFGSDRFHETPGWRFIVTDLAGATLTFLDHLALDRSVTVTRGAARVIDVRVPSADPEVNIPAPDPDGDPWVSEGTRLVYAFRREGRTGSMLPPWIIRAAGLVLGLDDSADADHATSTVTAYDPWKYLYRRPVLLADGSFPGEAGRVYPAGTSADDIIIEQFSLAEANGTPIFTDYASTGFYAGTIESCDPLPDGGDGLAITFARGATLGEMLDTLAATGTCDPVFDPVYDPVNRPGILCDFSLYRTAGEFRPDAIFGWDQWPRNTVQLTRQIDGSARANRMRMFAGQGGPPVPEVDDASSIARFGDYWATQYLVGVPSIAGAHTIAVRQLALLRSGQLTFSLSPAAERAPLLFQEYREADTVPLYASNRFRDPILGTRVRVESIPIAIGDDQLERVASMLVSYSPEGGS
jgi:hypothetical protein